MDRTGDGRRAAGVPAPGVAGGGLPAGAAWFRVWGTTVWVVVTVPGRLGVARGVVEGEIAAVGAACDRFDSGSEISRVNAGAGRAVRVSGVLGEVLERALAVAEATDGTVDPTVGAAMVAAGYDRDLDLVRRAPAVTRPPVPATGWWRVELARGVVRTPPGTLLDLGAVAKAYTADRAAERAARAAGCGVLVAIGGDLAVGGPAPEGGWPVRVAEDHRAGPEAVAQHVTIADGGLATSSTTVRRWRRADRPGVESMHHIIDPATGIPVLPHWRTASVAAGSCVDANAAATSAIVRGRAADTWLNAIGLPARLIDRNGTITTAAGWPTERTGQSPVGLPGASPQGAGMPGAGPRSAGPQGVSPHGAGSRGAGPPGAGSQGASSDRVGPEPVGPDRVGSEPAGPAVEGREAYG